MELALRACLAQVTRTYNVREQRTDSSGRHRSPRVCFGMAAGPIASASVDLVPRQHAAASLLLRAREGHYSLTGIFEVRVWMTRGGE